jgi:hypothetical protein
MFDYPPSRHAARNGSTTMKPLLRKLLLTTHVAVSLGWFGAAASVLALAIVGLHSPVGASAIYAATAVIWRAVIIPFSLAAVLTGIVQSLVTKWGLFRHYWVIAKLVIAVGAVLLLVAHTSSLLPALARAAVDGSAVVVEGHSHGHGGIPPRLHLVIAAFGTLGLLLITTALSVWKPWGRTKLGRPDTSS